MCKHYNSCKSCYRHKTIFCWQKADLAVCDLTITEQRKKVVDFSVPIMSLGISILYIQERQVSPDTFSFLYPYSLDVWMYIGTAYCVVSIVLYVCARYVYLCL